MKKLHPLIFFIINLIVPVMSMFRSSAYMPYYLFAVAAIFLILYKEERRLLKGLTFFVLFGVLARITISSDIAYIRLTSMMFFVSFYFIPLSLFASLLFFNYNPSEILSALQAIGLNRKFIIMVTITLRYMPSFFNEFRIMRGNMAMRGIKISWKHPIKSFGYFITPQLFRCSMLAEELTGAGLTKGIDNRTKRSSIFQNKWQLSDSLVLCLFFIGFGLTIYFGGVR